MFIQDSLMEKQSNIGYFFLQANNSFLRGPETIFTGREGLEISILGLKFRVTPKNFHQGDMKLKCLATIATVYWKSNEESVEEDRPQKAPVLESRESVLPSRVQGINTLLYKDFLNNQR